MQALLVQFWKFLAAFASPQLNAFAKRNNAFYFLIKYLAFRKILNYTPKLQIS